MLKAPLPHASPAPPEGRRARRRAETRERLFRAALELFARRGFSATTVADITEVADVGKGTFFNYFPTKEHVMGAFGELQAGKVAAAVEAARAGAVPARAALAALPRELAREPGRSPALVRALIAAVTSSEAVRQRMLANLARGRERLAELFALARRQGAVPRGADTRRLAEVFLRAYFGTLVIWALRPARPLGALLDESFAVFWAGAAAGAPARGKRKEKRR